MRSVNHPSQPEVPRCARCGCLEDDGFLTHPKKLQVCLAPCGTAIALQNVYIEREGRGPKFNKKKKTSPFLTTVGFKKCCKLSS